MLKKIVDVHCHVAGHENMLSEELRNLFARLLPWNCGLPTPEKLLEELDAAGVTYAVLQAYDLKEAGLDMPNEFVAEVLRQYPERFICGYASADPIKRGTPNAIAMLKDAYLKLDFKMAGIGGLKRHSADKFFLMNSSLFSSGRSSGLPSIQMERSYLVSRFRSSWRLLLTR
jgi:predicted TIM-barrel fold metal-dependent hydrolase